MQRRKFLIGAGSAAVGASALIGSGAFTSVQADRTVTVQTAGDANAYLALTGDGDYISNNNTNELTIDLGEGSFTNGGDGFNENAVTTVESVITIENQGTNEVQIDFGDEGGEGFETILTLDNAEVTFELPNTEEGRTVNTGDTAVGIDVTVDTTGDPSGNSQETLTIYASEINQ